MRLSLLLRSPRHDRASIILPAEAADPHKMMHGTVCSKFGDEYPIRNNIADMLAEQPSGLTLAQLSSSWSLSASVYEDTWRKNSLTLLTGEDFPLEEEFRLMQRWIKPEPGAKILDLGCATGVYARAAAGFWKDAQLVGIDISMPMLEEARRKSNAEGLHIYLLRADAAAMPFFSDSFDAALCGGSLNEFPEPAKALYELRRVLKSGACVFMMHLLSADSWYGRLLQQPAGWGGLHFWSRTESNQLFNKTGFSVEDQVVRGMVCFSLLKAA